MRFILGKKIEMSQKFEGEEVVAITKIQAGPCFVTQVKNKEKDGYQAVQIGFEELKEKKVKKPQQKKPFRHLKEFSAQFGSTNKPKIEISEYKVGDKIDLSVFKVGDYVTVAGSVKGRGFAGVMKRHGFSGMPETHGTKHDHRHGGSIGSTAFQRVVKGKKMAGRMGNNRITISNLKIVDIDLEKNILSIAGAVPGARNGLIEIKSF